MEPQPEANGRPRLKPGKSRATLSEKLGRARVTNRPRHLAAFTPQAQTRRRHDLVRIFCNALGPDITDLMLVGVKRAAELTCAAERARVLILTSDSVLAADLEMLSRLEGAAARATKALGIKDAAKPHVPLRDQLAAEIEDTDEAEPAA
jgi:hypothetical protein